MPLAGGTVDFDKRFGTGAKCGVFAAQDEWLFDSEVLDDLVGANREGVRRVAACMQRQDHPPLSPLSDAQFRALRWWAMNFVTVRRFGVAAWPFRYARAQEGRLRAMASKVPQGMLLAWVLVVATLWFFIGFAIGFLPLMPFLSANVSASRGALAGVSLTIGIAANLLSGCILGHVIAAWTGGRILNALMPLPALTQVNGDAELLAGIRRQIVRLALFGVLGAVEPLLAAMFLLQPQS